MPAFCEGYVRKPFKDLAENYPDEDVYPFKYFRFEWGPIFHRGRLDGSARILLIGQDPGQHENVLRRILVGEAGRRAQGFLAKLGITQSYVFINALLYSVYGNKGARYVNKTAIKDYRNRWINGILSSGRVKAVVTFGQIAKKAWQGYVKDNGPAGDIEVEHVIHPTFPESAGGTKAEMVANTKKMLAQWNDSLARLFPTISKKDIRIPSLVPYGDAFLPDEKVDIPSRDLPAGIPDWMYDDDGWASRGFPAKIPSVKKDAEKLLLKRRVIIIKVPECIIS